MIALYTHPSFKLHDTGAGHPESALRLGAIEDALISSGLGLFMTTYQAPAATFDQLCTAHDPDYVQRLLALQVTDQYHLDGDTVLSPHSMTAARHAAGAGIAAIEHVRQGSEQLAFCLVRPPGHHATYQQSMGFCIFNNVAIAARHAVTVGFKRVLIVDFDVHHGNGTEDIIAGDPQMLMLGFFGHPLYPHCGLRPAASNIVNEPLRTGTKGEQLLPLLQQKWPQIIAAFAPEIVLFSAGFDAHIEDDIGNLALVEQDYQAITQLVQAAAASSSGGRCVSFLEGGYALSALGRSVVAHLRTLVQM